MVEGKVAVVIPTRNRKKELIRCVNSVLLQDYSNFEVAVVDDNSEDKVAIDWFSVGAIRIIRNDVHSNAAASRNKAIRVSNAEIIILLDDDCWVEDQNWISKHVGMIKDFPKSLVGGRIINISRTIFGRIRAMMGDNCMQFNFLQSMNLSFRKTIFEEIGGFNERFNELEDLDFSQRAIRKKIVLKYDEKIICYHKSIDGFFGILRRQHRYGLWAIPVRKFQKYDWYQILPDNLFSSILLCLPLSLGIAFLQIINNMTYHPLIIFYAPMVWIYNLAYAFGIISFFWRKSLFKYL